MKRKEETGCNGEILPVSEDIVNSAFHSSFVFDVQTP